MKKFNTTAVCIPSRHYMVDLSERIKEIRQLVDDGKYFTINRARQYGKILYLKPIINGTGNYYIEAQTRDQTRTDVIIDYLGQQYIIELKIWRGDRYNAEGQKQIMEYLDYWSLNTGYMLSFNFNQKKEQGVKRVAIGDKILYEGTV